MANVNVTVQPAVEGGANAAWVTPNVVDTYLVPNDGKVMLHFIKTGAGSCNVLIETPKTVEGLAIGDRTIVVPATTGDVICGSFNPAVYNDSQGNLKLTFSEITGFKFGARRVD